MLRHKVNIFASANNWSGSRASALLQISKDLRLSAKASSNHDQKKQDLYHSISIESKIINLSFLSINAGFEGGGLYLR